MKDYQISYLQYNSIDSDDETENKDKATQYKADVICYVCLLQLHHISANFRSPEDVNSKWFAGYFVRINIGMLTATLFSSYNFLAMGLEWIPLYREKSMYYSPNNVSLLYYYYRIDCISSIWFKPITQPTAVYVMLGYCPLCFVRLISID